MLRNLARSARDRILAAATRSRRSVTVDGIELGLAGASPRMRYVLMRGYEREDARLAARFLGPEDAVLEAGASIGFMALSCIRTAGVRRYAMVEANPDLLPRIAENFALNGVEMPEVVNAAVTGADGEVAFSIGREFWSSSLIERPGTERTVRVPGLTIPTLVARLPFRPTTLIMDIEGAEASIPPEHYAPFDKLLIEFHPKLIGQAATDRILDALAGLGFRERARSGGTRFLARGEAAAG